MTNLQVKHPQLSREDKKATEKVYPKSVARTA